MLPKGRKGAPYHLCLEIFSCLWQFTSWNHWEKLLAGFQKPFPNNKSKVMVDWLEYAERSERSSLYDWEEICILQIYQEETQ